MSNSQKDIFLAGEADAWLERNLEALKKLAEKPGDPVFLAAEEIFQNHNFANKPRVLEVGCGNGQRLAALSQAFQADCYGLEPSSKAVELAQAQGVNAQIGTADQLPYPDNHFDILIFGFCLYLCDREDLFKIAQEANRVLKPNAWLLIYDFYAEAHTNRPYHHCEGVNSYKMDYRKLFDWHPAYTCYSHKVFGHGEHKLCDDPQEWIAISTLRKASPV
ncbi:methyltransferase domain-containing protein [Idiomarina abyssalis]|uniref:class I SAM-dependent methyltransferase n=1 Tax=Idiomarina abyssalis TaxID=86102 RepID=UPI003A92149F